MSRFALNFLLFHVSPAVTYRMQSQAIISYAFRKYLECFCSFWIIYEREIHHYVCTRISYNLQDKKVI